MKYTFLKDNNSPAFLGDDFEISYSSMYANILEYSKRIAKEGGMLQYMPKIRPNGCARCTARG